MRNFNMDLLFLLGATVLFWLCRKMFLCFVDACRSKTQERNIGLVMTPLFIINQVSLHAWGFPSLPILLIFLL